MFRITHNQKIGYLTAFHSNGGFEIGDVFPFSTRSWLAFKTENEAKDELQNIIDDCKKQSKRWEDWTEKALKFAKGLFVVEETQ